MNGGQGQMLADVMARLADGATLESDPLLLDDLHYLVCEGCISFRRAAREVGLHLEELEDRFAENGMTSPWELCH